jgi:hypothetical protein
MQCLIVDNQRDFKVTHSKREFKEGTEYIDFDNFADWYIGAATTELLGWNCWI